MAAPPNPSHRDDAQDTRERILDAAEKLFVEHGFSASLRRITAEASVNLASVHYHFGSKQALMEALMDRRITPLNRQRMQSLEALRANAGEQPIQVRSIIEAFIEPVFENLMPATEADHIKFCSLIGRMMTEQSEFFRDRIKSKFEDVVQSFQGELARSLPELSEQELAMRFIYMVGAINFTLSDTVGSSLVSEIVQFREQREFLLRSLVTYMTAGFKAPEERS